MLPLVGRTAQSLAAWLAPDEPGLRLQPDLDRIDALAAERGELWSRIGAASFLTDDEKRAAVGYGAAVGPAVKRLKLMPVAPSPLRDGGAGSETVTPAVYYPSAEGQPHWMTQPRVPPGSSDGGQWTDEGGVFLPAASYARAESESPSLTRVQDKRYSIDLNDEESEGGHTIERHVGQSDKQLAKRMNSLTYWGLMTWRAPDGIGTFPSLNPARRLVEETLTRNSDIVEEVRSGKYGESAVLIDQVFDRITGREVYRSGELGEMYYSETNAVRVVIRKSVSGKGFNVITAFPLTLPRRQR